MGLFYIRVTEQLERTGGEAVHANSTEEAIKEVERRIQNNELTGEMQVTSRQVSYAVDYEGGF